MRYIKLAQLAFRHSINTSLLTCLLYHRNQQQLLLLVSIVVDVVVKCWIANINLYLSYQCLRYCRFFVPSS